ncbi:T9SS type B sorting domain-containing protein [Hwangdonia lutea]|uniref:T9SS type B sorting domain-containing protein n=1 Tax=Hwangdonia lutea TaxID=3075823 RepID=A0AA97ELD8_9FLAO|nr:T9SS type B sorting domain-containing protein [Hwangdonia sp. SCSIO 19198]WOD42220.1 T9SS type B sorting domain-containing protein [Hwangdonia sp. SCSIO 19198]
MKTKILLLIFTLSVSLAFSQKQSANWYFGEYAGLNFNTPTPTPLTDGQLITKEGCATISDPNGNLLFYTDGVTIWDRRHQIMPNGEGLLGHSSSTESALIVPKPGSTSKYYVFTIDKPSYYLTEAEPIDGVNYSEIDLSLNSGFGDVVPGNKNNHLVTYDTNDAVQNEYKSSEKITAVSHSDGSSIWVITQFMNKFYAFLIDIYGVNETPIVSTVPQMIRPIFNDDGANITAIGYLKVSPDGKKIAIAHSSTNAGSPRTGRKKSGKVLLYDFNNTTGAVTNQLEILSGAYPYGVEFSPNSELLYITDNFFDENDLFDHSHLYQYNLESSNIVNSRETIRSSQNVAGALQLAINGKIYRAGFKTLGVGLDISVINQPNNIGTSCDYSENTVNLGGKASQLGLPPFVQSIFLYTFDYEDVCLGDQTHFFITSEEPYDSVLWDFGDGQTSILDEPLHTYQQAGVYTVSLTMYLNGVEQGPFLKQVIISQPPDVLQTTFDLVQCDSADNNPNDGIAPFNLQLANAPLSLFTQDAIQVYYYHTMADAINDTDNSKAINEIYTNQSNGEIVYAKVLKANTDCYSMATVRLNTTQALDIGTHQLGACDPDEDNLADFDLESESIRIATALNLPTNVDISFYEDKNDAAIGVNPLPNIYTSTNNTLYIRAESSNECYGTGVLNLEVKSFPQLEDQVVNVCLTDFPITINTGLHASEVSNYNYDWSTNDNVNEITVLQAGVYTVNVIDPLFNCEDTMSITVNQNEIPEIRDLIINDRDLTILLNNAANDFVYAIDDEFGVYQESNSFLNLPYGKHTLYIMDALNCERISKDFYILGFPKYFTPNNDSDNDTWNVAGLDPALFETQLITIEIFNRYGKLLKTFNPNQSDGWNGTFNGNLLTDDDYWYCLKLPSGEEYKGHFALKR